jgi:hypothetical protein
VRRSGRRGRRHRGGGSCGSHNSSKLPGQDGGGSCGGNRLQNGSGISFEKKEEEA